MSQRDQVHDDIDELIKELNTTMKSKVAATADSGVLLPDPKFWMSTGLDELDFAISQRHFGIPTGRFIEIFGENSKGKSALAASIAASFQRAGGIAALIDSEATFDKEFASQNIGLDLSKLVMLDAPFLEKGLEIINGYVAAYQKTKVERPTLLIWDTIAAASTEKEYKESQYAGGMAHKPRVLSEFFRKSTVALAQTPVAVLFLNQIRSSMDQTADDSPGGNALKHHCSVRITVKSQYGNKYVKGANDAIVGINVALKVIKNKVGRPFGEVNLPFYFDTGFNNIEAVFNSLINHANGGADCGVEQAKGWYRIYWPDRTNYQNIRHSQLGATIQKHPEIVEFLRSNLRKVLK